jgi:ABC-type transport system involved in cytochrome c biogenesis ATPase subunit
MIEVTNLTKKYGDHIAVDHLSFRVEKGQIYGFLGPNGAGKSTTMNIITGYLAATEGTVTIDGKDVQKDPEEAKRAIGYLPELPPLYVDMTVREYLDFVAELKKVPKKERKQQIAEVWNARTAEVSQREALDGSAVPFVACGTVIVVLVRVWTYLNAAERQLCTWIDIAESVRTDKRIDVVGRCLRCRNLSGGVMLAGCRTRKCGKHGERNYYFLYLHYCHCLFSLSLVIQFVT